jgi:hypothetical protein
MAHGQFWFFGGLVVELRAFGSPSAMVRLRFFGRVFCRLRTLLWSLSVVSLRIHAGTKLFYSLLDNSRLILSFNNRISRRCHVLVGGRLIMKYIFLVFRFSVSSYCGDYCEILHHSSFDQVDASTGFGVISVWSAFPTGMLFAYRRYGRFPLFRSVVLRRFD